MSRGERPIEEIAPDDFLSTWGASSYEEGLKAAARARTTTPEDELPRCPDPVCHSKRVKKKTPKRSGSQTKDGSWVCRTCRNHFNNPVYGEPDELDDEAPSDPFEWLDDDELEDPPVTRRLRELDDETLTALAIFLYSPWAHTDSDPSYRDIGTALGRSRQWVGERVRAWRDDGAYHDLVRDPRPRVAIAAEEVSGQ